MLKRFFKDGVVYGLAGLFARSVSIITLPLYTRVLSPTDFGVIDLTLLFTVFCGVIISSGVARFFPDETTAEGKMLIASSGLWFISLTHLLFVAAALSFAEPLMVWTLGSVQWSQAYYLGLVMIVTGGFFHYFQNRFNITRCWNFSILKCSWTCSKFDIHENMIIDEIF